MLVDGVLRRTIEWSGDHVAVIDQTQLPFAVETRLIGTWREMADAITTMVVRGAPLIGVAVAHGIALAAAADPSNQHVAQATAELVAARPTAINARWAADRMTAIWRDQSPSDRATLTREAAQALANADVSANRQLAINGAAELKKRWVAAGEPVPLGVLTHCNAGWLATVDWGTALAPLFELHRQGVPLHVWVDETRPRQQGLLTAWELQHEGVPHTLIPDTAAGTVLSSGKVHAVVVGTDRTTADGDVVNKIGTYQVALAATDNNVAFYVAAPTSSIDFSIRAGSDVPIEQRAANEVTEIRGRTNNAIERVRLTTHDTAVLNPAFDVTPARLVTAFITEGGVVAPTGLDAIAR